MAEGNSGSRRNGDGGVWRLISVALIGVIGFGAALWIGNMDAAVRVNSQARAGSSEFIDAQKKLNIQQVAINAETIRKLSDIDSNVKVLLDRSKDKGQ